MTLLGKGASLASKFKDSVAVPVLENALGGVLTDPIIDANQVQANTKDTDQMNLVIGTMFDTTFLGLGKGFNSMNEIAAKYAKGDMEPAIKALQKAYSMR